jgi:hypothetical protein
MICIIQGVAIKKLDSCSNPLLTKKSDNLNVIPLNVAPPRSLHRSMRIFHCWKQCCRSSCVMLFKSCVLKVIRFPYCRTLYITNVLNMKMHGSIMYTPYLNIAKGLHVITVLITYTMYFFPLWLYSPILGLGRLHETFRFTSVTRSRTVNRTPWTDDQLVARPLPIHKHRKMHLHNY